MSSKPHGLTGRPSNRALPDDKKLKRRAFSAADPQWSAYTACAEDDELKTQEWMRRVLDKEAAAQGYPVE